MVIGVTSLVLFILVSKILLMHVFVLLLYTFREHTHTYTHTHIRVSSGVCVCVNVYKAHRYTRTRTHTHTYTKDHSVTAVADSTKKSQNPFRSGGDSGVDVVHTVLGLEPVDTRSREGTG